MNFNHFNYYEHMDYCQYASYGYNACEIPYTSYVPMGPTFYARSDKPPPVNPFTKINNQIPSISPPYSSQANIPPKVLVNPHFKKTVYINPNFNAKSSNHPNGCKIHINPNMVRKVDNPNKNMPSMPTIHINPKMQSDKINQDLLNAITARTNGTAMEKKTIHVNPNILKMTHKKDSEVDLNLGKKIVSTKNKLIRVPQVKKSVATNNLAFESKRRSSLVSKYKYVKSSLLLNTGSNKLDKFKHQTVNKFRIDNRMLKAGLDRKAQNSFNTYRKKYVYANKFVSISDIAKSQLIRNIPKIKKKNISPHKKIINSLTKDCKLSKSKYKLVRRVMKTPSMDNKKTLLNRQFKIIRKLPMKKKTSLSKLKKCNVPCAIYRKYGRCLGKDRGTCYLKHNPDQISLCTKFLQGACINDKCRLSHKVSPEKMPTCKYYLEGSCSRENCQYLHVKISQKAEICRDFLEGYCEKAVECDKRHQYQCPEFEKTGSCPKRRCPYPHGNMVRKYTVNKNIVKKCSGKKQKIKSSVVSTNETIPSTSKSIEPVEKSTRYYEGKEHLGLNDDELNSEMFEILRSRPKLGTLPGYIPFFNENK